MTTFIMIVLCLASFILGVAVGTVYKSTMGTLHIDKTGEKDNYLFEIQDLNAIEKKSTISLKIDLKE